MTAPRKPVLFLWRVLLVCVVAGSLLPADSPVMVGIGSFHINDKVLHSGAYLALSLLPVIGFDRRRKGIAWGLSMFLLGVLLEAAQHFSPGRSVELGDLLANGLGVACGTVLGSLLRAIPAYAA
jgi:VanZ family protein